MRTWKIAKTLHGLAKTLHGLGYRPTDGIGVQMCWMYCHLYPEDLVCML